MKSRRVRWLAAPILVAGIAAGVAISLLLTSGDSSPPSTGLYDITQANLGRAAAGLCEARADVEAGDLAAARSRFVDDVHVFLHSLAAEVQTKDRDAASELLIAKYRVEMLLSLPTSGATAVPADGETDPSGVLADLIASLKRAAATAGLQAPDC